MIQSRRIWMSHVAHMNELCRTYPRLSAEEHAAIHWNILQHTATHCNTLQNILHAYSCDRLKISSYRIKISSYRAQQHATIHCNTLQHTATHRKTLQHRCTRVTELESVLHEEISILSQCVAVCCILMALSITRSWELRSLHIEYWNTLQHTATNAIHCNTLQHTATHCNTDVFVWLHQGLFI